MWIALVLALVASVTGVILRGPSVTSDTYIRNLWPSWNLNTQTRAWWDGPLTINPATQIISAINTDTSAILIKFDLRSFVGASLVPNKRAWLNYYVTDVGDNSSLRELVVPWNEVCTPTAKTRALPSQPRAALRLRPLRADDASLSLPLPAFDSPQSRGTTSHSQILRGHPPTLAAPQPGNGPQASLAGIGMT